MLKIIKKNKFHLLYGTIIILLITQLANNTGQIKGLEEKEMILKNIACSLPEIEFEQTLHSLSMPTDLKEMLGDNHVKAWEVIKDNLINECYA